ncbi:2-oxoacid:acceptor oxidoreductase family protein [Alkaliphilus hydrothermalis]|uniref:Pyruvate ferredoxin oxidoreductase gamma subunit n=1 Tax=Alkaliphilus hydrothermalis TaxID=1482730 RepID=A0ABS2NUG6_9FIRM|nr:2-oxoacid:acceptor oxidoreductase family protein [Alkaliphilus hydrothermalis]MBM7616446.1 pyruvate ferredoxin oxidoreductase gamma subunit [Alkaliphilus hydrothermalis]
MQKGALPSKNQFGFFEIRLESIGGLGANVAGKIIAEAGVVGMGFNGSNFASYGSEKKGTPVSSYIRYCDANKPIRINSPVTEPHILGVFHENLAARLPITAGVKSNSTVVINTDKSPQEAREYLRLSGGSVITVDAIKIAYEEKVRMNVVMIGAITKAMEFMDKEAMREAIKETFGKKYKNQLEANLRGFEAGYERVAIDQFDEDGRFPFIPFNETKSEWGYENAPIGGIILEAGSNVVKNNQSSRQGKIPLFHEGRCIHCGMCETTCPDYCFKFEPKEDSKTGKTLMFNIGLDYQYCKGCLRCVDVCPVEALTEELEADHEIEKMTAKL